MFEPCLPHLWSPVLPTQLPQPGEVHLWRSPLLLAPAQLTTCQRWLCPEEHARAQRFRFDQHRHRFIAARAHLRSQLGYYLRQAPDQVQFTYNPQGKPALLGETLQFNLAHSADWMLLAVTQGAEIGVDLEQQRSMPDQLALARRFFAASEVAALERLADPQQAQQFFQLWTAKEALLKATGQGLAGLSGLEVAIAPGSQPSTPSRPPPRVQLQILRWPNVPTQAWWVGSWSPLEQFVGAVAIAHPAPRFHGFRVQDELIGSLGWVGD